MRSRRGRRIGFALGATLVATMGGVLLLSTKSPSQEGDPNEAAEASEVQEAVELTGAARSAQTLGEAFGAVASSAAPAVVRVSSERVVRLNRQEGPMPFPDDFYRQFFGDAYDLPSAPHRDRIVPEHDTGSGIIVDPAGFILTNYHVVKDVTGVKVTTFDKRTFSATVVGSDPKTDVAVIRIKDKVPEDLPVAHLGDSDSVDVGEFVLAIGAPFGLAQTVTSGIVSAKGRSNVGVADYEDFLQTDAAINPGNSGGPLVDMHGEVIGMNTAIATSVGQYSGVGFSIPSNMLKNIFPVLMKGGLVKRGMLGVLIQDVTSELAEYFHLPEAGGTLSTEGAVITRVHKGGPADKAGLKVGDVITRYDGKSVEDTRQLRNLVAETTPNSKVEVVALRDGKEISAEVVITLLGADRPAPAVSSDGARGSDLGLVVKPLGPDAAKELGYEGEQGLVVARIDEAGLAASTGLKVDDLIIEVNRHKVNTAAEFESALAKAKNNALLLIRRQSASLFVVLRPTH